MKNLIVTISLLFCVAGAKAQITFEHFYPGGQSTFSSNLRIVHFSSHGYMYEYFTQKTATTCEIFLYNLNHSFYKSIPVTTPLPIDDPVIGIMYVSDSLFNTTPSDIEYLLYYRDAINSIAHILIKDDAGNTLFSKDSVEPGWMESFDPGVFMPYTEPIFYTPNGYKMILYQDNTFQNDTGAYVYSLPGALPCNECSGGVETTSISPNTQSRNNGSLSNAYPNPTNHSTTIGYVLPDGINQGQLVFYDLQGNEVKSFIVDRTFTDIVVTTTDLAAGTYLYVLRTSNGYVGSKKMVVIK